MTLDEAIEHAEERARGNDQCAKDHAQLSDWLRELRRARMEIDLLKTLRNGFRADAQKYKAENAKLRELAYKAWKAAEKLCNAFPDSCDSSGYDPCPIGEHNEVCVHGQLEREMRELGIEVDG